MPTIRVLPHFGVTVHDGKYLCKCWTKAVHLGSQLCLAPCSGHAVIGLNRISMHGVKHLTQFLCQTHQQWHQATKWAVISDDWSGKRRAAESGASAGTEIWASVQWVATWWSTSQLKGKCWCSGVGDHLPRCFYIAFLNVILLFPLQMISV